MKQAPNKEMRFQTLVALHSLIAKVKGKGTAGLAKVKRVRRALEKAVLKAEVPAFFRDDEDRTFFGVEPDHPLYLCPECEKGYVTFDDDGKLEACRVETCGFSGPYDPDPDDIVGYRNIKNVQRQRVWAPLKSKAVSGTVWPEVLLPLLEGEHNVADEDMIEKICRDFEDDGLLKQFETVTEADKEDEDEDDEEEEKGPKAIELEPDPESVDMPKEGVTSQLKEEASAPKTISAEK